MVGCVYFAVQPQGEWSRWRRVKNMPFGGMPILRHYQVASPYGIEPLLQDIKCHDNQIPSMKATYRTNLHSGMHP